MALAETPRSKRTSQATFQKDEKTFQTQKDLLDFLKKQANKLLRSVAAGLDLEEHGQVARAAEVYRALQNRVRIILQVDPDLAFPPRGSANYQALEGLQARLATLAGQLEEALFRIDSPTVAGLKPASKPSIQCPTPTSSSTNKCLFRIAEGVRLCRLTVDGRVSAPSAASSLQIEETADAGHILRVGQWSRRLEADCSTPCLITNSNLVVLPTEEADVLGSSVGLLLPVDLSEEQQVLFISWMTRLTRLASERQEEEGLVDGQETTAQAISRRAEIATTYAVKGLLFGAQLTGQALELGGAKLKQLLPACSQSESSRQLDARAESMGKALAVSNSGTQKLAEASQWAVDSVGQLASKGGAWAGPQLRHAATRLLPASVTQSGGGQPGGRDSPLDVALVCVGSGAESLSDLLDGLSTAGRIVGASLTSSTVDVVSHRFGENCGRATREGLETAGNVKDVVFNVRSLGPRGLAKLTVKSLAIGAAKVPPS